MQQRASSSEQVLGHVQESDHRRKLATGSILLQTQALGDAYGFWKLSPKPNTACIVFCQRERGFLEETGSSPLQRSGVPLSEKGVCKTEINVEPGPTIWLREQIPEENRWCVGKTSKVLFQSEVYI